MTDRELLELAAKAAGYEVDFNRWMDCGAYTLYWNITTNRWWNPLANDGDALRLAVKLNMGISIPVFRKPRADIVCFRDSSVNIIEEGDDPYAATRRTNDGAAASIGEQMK